MKPLSVYIHIPFCEKKCAYCDFVSFDNCQPQKIDSYINALCKEIKHEKAAMQNVRTIFLGGGTPSLLTNAQMLKIFECLPKASEVTIETNPNSITAGKLKHWLKLGINRISIGVQSFDDVVLKKLGRIHTAGQAISAIKLAYASGFRNTNIDLIHSVTTAPIIIPAEIFKFVTHVSAYCLIIEEGKPFVQIPETESIKQQKQIERILKNQGFKKYEVSNFAKIGFECEHNKAYWQPLTHQYIGYGLGAHSFLHDTRYMNTTDFDGYLLSPSRAIINTSSDDRALESIMLGLRTARGIDISLLNNKSAEIEFLKNLKLIKQIGTRIAATQKGFFVLNSVIEKLT